MRWTTLLLALPLAAQNSLWVDLSGPWRVQSGDDLAYTRPEFDDSQWRTVDLPLGARAASLGQPVPGSGSGTAFCLRRRVALPPGADPTRLALTLGVLQWGHEVWVNGRHIGGTGPYRVPEHAPLPQPVTLEIAPEAVAAGQTLTIAVRVWRGAFAHYRWLLADRGPYVLTYASNAPSGAAREQLRDRLAGHLPAVVLAAMMFCIAVISGLAWWSDRARRELLWFALLALNAIANIALIVAVLQPSSRPLAPWGGSTPQLLQAAADVILPGQFALAALGPGRRRWWTAAQAAGCGLILSIPFLAGGLPRFAWGMLLCGSVTMAIVAADSWRQRMRPVPWEVWLLRATILLLALGTMGEFGQRLLRIPPVVPSEFRVGDFDVNREEFVLALLSAVILAILLRRQAADRREQQRLAGELEAARLVQQLLLAPAGGGSGMAVVDAVYEPAQEVGGDFYWTRVEPDGSVIAAVGDVSGKGLKAAMLVSVAIGILRTGRSGSPAAILGTMNDGLAGHTGGGFVTCCCARFDADGRVTVANAGHPPPYCDGQEVAVEAGLPLGVVPGATYEETAVSGECFTFVSDGVVEAENSQRELFGFERTREISTKSASEIAEAAKAWGQNDDITVVTVRRAMA